MNFRSNPLPRPPSPSPCFPPATCRLSRLSPSDERSPFAMQLICLSDLENDFINPHDSTTRVNRWVVRCPALSSQPDLPCAFLHLLPLHLCMHRHAAVSRVPLGRAVQVPELLIQATLTALLVFSGKWFSGLLHVAVFAYHVRG